MDCIEGMQADFEELLGDPDTADVVLKCQGKEIRGHKLILGARSAVLRRMFATQMLEQRNGVVEVEDDNYEDFHQMIRYLYMAKVDDGYDRFDELLVLADKYQVKRLSDLCAKRIKEMLTEENVLDLGMFGEILNSDALVKSCATFISTRMSGCLKQGDIEKIIKSPKLNKELLRILRDNDKAKFVTVSRFEKSSEKDDWEHNGNSDAIIFRVSSPVALVGIGLYGSSVDKELDVEISIYQCLPNSIFHNEDCLQTVKTKFNSKGSLEPVKIRLSPVAVEAEKNYEIVTEIQGGKTFSGLKGNCAVVMKSEEGDEIYQVEFSSSPMHLANRTSATRGQIPCLLFAGSMAEVM